MAAVTPDQIAGGDHPLGAADLALFAGSDQSMTRAAAPNTASIASNNTPSLSTASGPIVAMTVNTPGVAASGGAAPSPASSSGSAGPDITATLELLAASFQQTVTQLASVAARLEGTITAADRRASAGAALSLIHI